MPWSIRILRAFLGVTFVFAGMQKFLDPNFLRPGGGDYIGTQLAGFATGTPAASLMRVLEHAPVLTGIAIALVEIAVGLATLAGIGDARRLARRVRDQRDPVALRHVAHAPLLPRIQIRSYAVAWLALAAGIVEVEHDPPGSGRRADRADRRDQSSRVRARKPDRGRAPSRSGSRRRHWRALHRRRVSGTLPIRRAGPAARSAAPSGSVSPSATPAAPATPGRSAHDLDALPVGRAVGFTDPRVGPAVLLRLANDQVVAYSRACTHEGCLVGYDQSSRSSSARVTEPSSIRRIKRKRSPGRPDPPLEVDQGGRGSSDGDVILPA